MTDAIEEARLVDRLPRASLVEAQDIGRSRRPVVTGKAQLVDRLLEQRIRRFVRVRLPVVAGRARLDARETDLAHFLLQWQQAGIAMHALDLAAAQPRLVPIRVTKPAWFGSTLQRLLVTVGLRRNSAGGVGAVVPEAASHGTGFA